MINLEDAGISTRQTTLPVRASAIDALATTVAWTAIGVAILAAVTLTSSPAALAAEPAQPFEAPGSIVPGGPQLLAPEASATPAAPPAEPRTFETVRPPTPTPDLMSAPPAGAFVNCPDEYWVASSWRCRQTAPHGCACGDLDFYHVGGGATQLLNRESFAASLTPGVPVCIVVHGSFTNWKGLCDDCSPVLHWIRGAAPQRPLHVLFYSWPSQGGITYAPHVDVAILGTRASFNGIYLAELIARIPPGHPVCLVGHSHGARMVTAALHALGGGDVDNARLTWPPAPDLRVRGVLIAGALDHHWLDPGQRFEMALCRTECLLVLRNDHDIVLTFYPLRKPFSHRALGERGLSNRDLRRLGPLSSKVAVMDVTQVVQTGHMWEHYYCRPEIAAAIEPYIYFDGGQQMMMLPPAPAVSDAQSLGRSGN